MPQSHCPEQYAHKDHIYTLWTFPNGLYIADMPPWTLANGLWGGLYGAYKKWNDVFIKCMLTW